MFYNTSGTLRPRVTQNDQDEYISKGFVKVEESAICVVSVEAMTLIGTESNLKSEKFAVYNMISLIVF